MVFAYGRYGKLLIIWPMMKLIERVGHGKKFVSEAKQLRKTPKLKATFRKIRGTWLLSENCFADILSVCVEILTQ